MGKKEWTRNQKLLLWTIIISVVVAIIGGAFQYFSSRKESVSVSKDTTAITAPYVIVKGDVSGDVSNEQNINNGYDELLLLKYGDSQRKLGSKEKEAEQLVGEVAELQSKLQEAKKRVRQLEEGEVAELQSKWQEAKNRVRHLEEKIQERKQRLNLILIRQIQKTKLPVIEEPKHLSRAVIHGKSLQAIPFFVGTGYINHLCGTCQKVIAEQAWPHSISNIVVECPLCNTYNEFIDLPVSNYPRVLLSTGNYNFSSYVNLRTDATIEGSIDPCSFK